VDSGHVNFLTSLTIALALVAAEAIVAEHLAGRSLPSRLHRAVVDVVKTRLIEGTVPVMDRSLRKLADQYCSQDLRRPDRLGCCAS
jgi:hypothetical protein